MTTAKAVIAALVAFLGALAAGLDDDALDVAELVLAASAGLTAYAATWRVRNRELVPDPPAPPTPPRVVG